MEPRIPYVKTSDGVNIAYWTLGESVPLVEPPVVPRCGSIISRQLSALWTLPCRSTPHSPNWLGAEERVATDTLEVAIAGGTFRKTDCERWRLCCQGTNMRVTEETDRKS